jgi:hypothetical protein
MELGAQARRCALSSLFFTALLGSRARRPALGRFRTGLSTVYCLLRLPLTGGRSYGALDLLFEHKVPAWRFARTKADRASFRSAGYVRAADRRT